MEEMEFSRGDFSWFAGLLNIHEDVVLGFWLLYASVVILSILVFNLGFARKLPLLKNVIVYVVLLIGCFPLTFFAIGMPVVESLIVTALVLGIYRLRRVSYKKKESEA